MTLKPAASVAWRWLAVGAGLGLTSALAQVLLLRELLVGFRGNEFSLGISLTAWLMCVAVGSAIGARISRGRARHGAQPPPATHPRVQLAVWPVGLGFILLGLIPPVSIWFARDLRHLLGVPWGEFIPVSRLVYSTGWLIAPVGVVVGMMFPLVCRAADDRAGMGPARVYLAESVGFLAGGIVSFAIADIVRPFAVALMTAVLAAIFAMLAAWDNRTARRAIALWLVVAAAALGAGVSARLERLSLSNLYPGQQIVATAYSRYGSWAALAHVDQVSFYHNGALAFTAPDVMAAETLAHLAVLEHPRPRRVLLIGGGLDGTAAELLKHPGLRLDYVELDPAVVPLARACSQRTQLRLDAVMFHARLRFSRCDGRLFVKRAAAARAHYDIIIVNLPEPSTALLNRFYTLEFFTEARRALGAYGVLCVGLPGAENYIGGEMQALHGSVYHSLRRVFAGVVVTPGERAYFFASPRRGFISLDAAELGRRWQTRAVPVLYFSTYYIDAILPRERVDFVRQSCESAPQAINRDFRPAGYFYDVAFAGLAEGILPAGALKRLRALPVPLMVVTGVVLFGVPLALSRRGHRLRRGTMVGGVAAAGLMGMTLELCLLFAFQVLNGHIYAQVGALVAIFMAGLAAGTWREGRALARGRPAARRWLGWLITGAAVAAATPPILTWLEAAPIAGGLVSAAVVSLLMAACGAVVGALFPLAVRMLGDSAAAAGTVYAADVAGAALGALVAAVVALPLLGLSGTCFAAAGIVGVAAALSALARRV